MRQQIKKFWAFSNAHNRNIFVINWLYSLPKGKSILDAGAGFQRYKQYANHLEYTSQDLGEYKGGEKCGEKKFISWDLVIKKSGLRYLT